MADIGNGQAVISAVDFFTPFVDDAYDFGRVSAANALSNVYITGGRPVVAVAMLGWPAQLAKPAVFCKIMEGARVTCQQAGIPLLGGHVINNPEPAFGMAVTGL